VAPNGNGPQKSVGRKGATQTTFTFMLNAQQTPDGGTSSTYSGYFGTGKFLTQRVVLNFGLGLFGSGDSDPSSTFDGGVRLYFTPGRAGSAYVSGGAGATTMGSGDFSQTAGSFFGGFGFEGATSPYSTVFGEGLFETLSVQGGTTNQFRLRVGLRLLL
jgi:hypothetical protein